MSTPQGDPAEESRLGVTPLAPDQTTGVSAAQAQREFGASMLAQLEALAGTFSTVDLELPSAGDSLTTPLAAPAEPRSRSGERYRIGVELGRGGMGMVFSCRDADLGRDVAMKILHEKVAKVPGMTQRFIEEAQIGGQLQHPGVPPVHEFGIGPDKRPYFTMKLVQGQTLGELLGARRTPSEDRHRFLDIFTKACQAMAYAHSRGVIHRDLKPGNIMVGAFGEVLVMDWGLAKALGAPGSEEADAAGAANHMSARTGTTTSQAGSVMGTPAYMAPEQARGAVGSIDRRSDVFSLGAILCVILTGDPPYLGSREMVLAQAAAASQADTYKRLAASGADPELTLLCHRCLAADPDARPQSAGQLADELTAYLHAVDERAREAQLAAEAARIRVIAERRARRLTVVLAVTVLVAVIGTGAGYTYLSASHRAEANQHLTEAMSAASRLWGEAQAAGRGASDRWRATTVAADQARELASAGVDDDLRRQALEMHAAIVAQAETVAKEHAMLDRLDALTREHGGRFDFQTEEPPYAPAFSDFGIDIEALPAEEAAQRIEDSGIREDLLLALDAWATARRRMRLGQDESRWKELRLLANLADDDPERRRLRAAILTTDSGALAELAAAADLESRSAWYLDNLALALSESGQADLAMEVYRRGLLTHPGSFWLHHNLAMLLSLEHPPRSAEAAQHMMAALALDDGSARLWLELGNQLYNTGQSEEAVRAYRRSIAVVEPNPKAWYNLGIALARNGQEDDAIAAYLLAMEQKPDFPDPHFALALLWRRRGVLSTAESELRLAIQRNPSFSRYYQVLGEVLADLDREQEAEEVLRQAVTLAPDDARAHMRLGSLLVDRGRLEDAVVSLRRATELSPGEFENWLNLAHALNLLDRPEDAIDALRQAVSVAGGNPLPSCRLGFYLIKQGRAAEAIDYLRFPAKAAAALPPAEREQLEEFWSELRRQIR